MFKVATAGGFLIFNTVKRTYDVHPDSRLASLFPSFKEADDHARNAVGIMFGRVNQYWDILTSATFIDAASASLKNEIKENQNGNHQH